MMKPLFFLLLLFITNLLQSQNPGTVIITGEVKDLEADLGEWLMVKAYITDFAGESTRIESEFLNNDKTFILSFEMDRPQDISFSCGKFIRQLYIRPGDSLHIELQSIINEQEISLKVVSGGDQEMNHYMGDFVKMLETKHGYFGKHDNIKQQNSAVHKEAILNEMQVWLNDLSDFIKECNIQYPLFINWAKNHIYYSAADALWMFPIMRAMESKSFDENKEVPASYFDFEKHLPASNDSAQNVSAYARFLNTYGIGICSPMIKSFNKGNNRLLLDSMPAFMIHFINAKVNGFAKEVILTNIFLSNLQAQRTTSFFQNNLNKYYNEVNDFALRKKVTTLYHTVQNGVKTPLIEALNKLQFPDSLKNILPAILEKHQGKVIVLDFWGTWCAPCLDELERLYPVLVPKFDPEKVAFVFLANSSIKGIWEKKVSEFKFTGDHYILNAGQSAVMSEIFGVSALPHHAIIDAEGNIVEKSVLQLSEEIINKYLKE